jgi:predicted acylesterase/phospholipase RssA
MLKHIKYLVLQAGGTKCAWQAGFLAALETQNSFMPETISAVSASVAVACAMACRRLEFAVDCFKAAMAENRKNVYISRLFSSQAVFPQAMIYREALLRAFDQSALEQLHEGPDIQVLVARTSPRLASYPGVTIGLAFLALRDLVKHEWHRRIEKQLGFCKEFISVKQCATPAELADLILASSCTPPFTPWYSLHGRRALDGGLLENIPLSGLPQKAALTLVLLTAKGISIKSSPDMVYAEPSEELRISSWDYTDPRQIDNLYALGKKDGSAFVQSTQHTTTFANN